MDQNIIQNAPLTKLNIFSWAGVQMRTFHITWFSFFISFFSWFALAPLMPIIKAELGLTKDQIGNILIASVSATIFARLIIGRLCDKFGPRKVYTVLLVLGAIPLSLVGLATNYTSFLIFRLIIGCIGGSFVITQFHTSQMFAPNIKGTANAVTGGWGNLGGGVTNILMPLVFTFIVGLGFTKAQSWRLSMILPALLMLLCAVLYWKFTKDTPAGNFDEIGHLESKEKPNYKEVLLDWRVWALTLAYAVCFGMEITFDGTAALYFTEYSQNFKVSLELAGLLAGSFGLMNLFARAMGGWIADKIGSFGGLGSKGILLSICLILEGCGLIFFAQANNLTLAIISMIFFALFLKMANGATYSITPFVNVKNYGLVAGIVGAGGNIGGMLMGFLFKRNDLTYSQAYAYIGYAAIFVGLIIAITKFNKEDTVISAV